MNVDKKNLQYAWPLSKNCRKKINEVRTVAIVLTPQTGRQWLFSFIQHSAAEIRVKDTSGFMSRDKRFCVKDLLQAISVTTRFVLQLRTLSIVRNDAILLLRCIVGN